METKQIVMLMDFENLVIGLENNDSDNRKFFSASALLSYIEKNYGKVTMGTLRKTYIFDEIGTLLRIIEKVDTKNHSAQVLE